MIRKPRRKPPIPEGTSLPAGAAEFSRLEAARAGLLVWMDSEEAAEYLGVSGGRFRDAAGKGEFDRYKDLGGYRYHRDDLESWRRRRGARRAS